MAIGGFVTNDYDLLKNALEKLGFEPNPKQIEQFMTYRQLLLEWNGKMNLTAITTPREILLKHFADCSSVAAYAESGVVDVGTGAGFPGVPVKILRPDLELTLLDSHNKRITFLRMLQAELGLNGIEFLHARAEDTARNIRRESFESVLSRAVAKLPVLVEYCLPLVKPGGRFIAMKGPSPENELAAAQKLITALGGGHATIKRVDIPFTDITHSIVIIEKQRTTPEKYPRAGRKLGS